MICLARETEENSSSVNQQLAKGTYRERGNEEDEESVRRETTSRDRIGKESQRSSSSARAYEPTRIASSDRNERDLREESPLSGLRHKIRIGGEHGDLAHGREGKRASDLGRENQSKEEEKTLLLLCKSKESSGFIGTNF